MNFDVFKTINSWKMFGIDILIIYKGGYQFVVENVMAQSLHTTSTMHLPCPVTIVASAIVCIVRNWLNTQPLVYHINHSSLFYKLKGGTKPTTGDLMDFGSINNSQTSHLELSSLNCRKWMATKWLFILLTGRTKA